MSNPVNPIPEGHHSLTPYLIVTDGAGAVAFYEKVFHAVREEVMLDPSGRIRHAELKIGDSMLMLGEHAEVEERSDKLFPRLSIYHYVENADEVAERAVAGGARVLHAVEKKFYGNREGGFEDPFGIVWWIATRVEVLSPDEWDKRSADSKTEDGGTAK